jgi:hypothetical protein
MRTTSVPLSLAAVSVLVLAGCGTVANFATLKPKVYGGVDQDITFFSEQPPRGLNSGSAGGNPKGVLILLGLLPAEFCCTFVADTLTLPITMILDQDWHQRQEDRVLVEIDGPL